MVEIAPSGDRVIGSSSDLDTWKKRVAVEIAR